jgi:hypothetical protein
MAANIAISGRTAWGTWRRAFVWRARDGNRRPGGPALVLAALAAHGENVLGGSDHLDRGHDTESVTHHPVFPPVLMRLAGRPAPIHTGPLATLRSPISPGCGACRCHNPS